jgi:thiamine-phosphate pyrophosphorylase
MKSEPGRLYLLFSPALCRREPVRNLELALDGGVDRVQWRLPGRDRDGLERCLAVCRERGVPVIVNDDVELAVLADADGAHVGQGDMPVARARAVLGAQRALGASTHDAEQIRAAERAGADHFGFGPCFPTATKGYARGLGPQALALALRATLLPVYAIGGITAENLPELLAVGCTRIAVSSAILRASDPCAAAARLRALLDAPPQSSSIASPNE